MFYIYDFLKVGKFVRKETLWIYYIICLLLSIPTLYFFWNLLNFIKISMVFAGFTWLLAFISFFRFWYVIKQSTWNYYALKMMKKEKINIDEIEEKIDENFWKWFVNSICIIFFDFVQAIVFLISTFIVFTYIIPFLNNDNEFISLVFKVPFFLMICMQLFTAVFSIENFVKVLFLMKYKRC